MPDNQPVLAPAGFDEREKFALWRHRSEDLYDVVFYYPKLDTFRHYTGRFSLTIEGPGDFLTTDELIELMKSTEGDKTWSATKLRYLYRE